MVETSNELDSLNALVKDLPDPEIPVITLGDLGIVREIRQDGGAVIIQLTPTYSGCPATEAIRDDVLATVKQAGYTDVRVEIVLSPAWSSNWISERGRERLRAYGIAPPIDDEARASLSGAMSGATSGAAPGGSPIRSQVIRLHRKTSIACPRCASVVVEELSAYGSTPCKALYRCLSCREPFDYFKPY